jgi:putative ABC transport system ATP-binding protein
VALLTCRGLARRPWFSGLDLDLAKGEIVVLHGRTGSGKSLLLRALADLDPLDAEPGRGRLSLDGVARTELSASEWRRKVLYVHQGGVVLPGTVRENVTRLVTLVGTPIDPQAPALPMPPGLEESADAERLSGGERQVLALHIALLCDPHVLLLDESTSALDPEAAAQWEVRIRAWADEGHAVLWVAHDPALAARLGARVERFP